MHAELKDTVAIVTGASRGIGRAISTTLAAHGVRVAAVARTPGALEETLAACARQGVPAYPVCADLGERDAARECVAETVKEFGRLDFLVNNAGVFGGGASDEADLALWDRTLDVNLRAVIHLTRHALPEIEKQRRGAVVNIASISGKQSSAGAADYCATKHGVMGYSGSLFEDVRERGIKVCAICPGFVNTDMVGGGLVPERMIQPEDIAELVLMVLRFPDNACPTEIVVRPQRSPYA